MRFLKPNNAETDLQEIQVTIDVAERCVEMVEIYRDNENGPGFVQVTSIKTIEPNVGFDRDNDVNTRGFLS